MRLSDTRLTFAGNRCQYIAEEPSSPSSAASSRHATNGPFFWVGPSSTVHSSTCLSLHSVNTSGTHGHKPAFVTRPLRNLASTGDVANLQLRAALCEVLQGNETQGHRLTVWDVNGSTAPRIEAFILAFIAAILASAAASLAAGLLPGAKQLQPRVHNPDNC